MFGKTEAGVKRGAILAAAAALLLAAGGPAEAAGREDEAVAALARTASYCLVDAPVAAYRQRAEAAATSEGWPAFETADGGVRVGKIGRDGGVVAAIFLGPPLTEGAARTALCRVLLPPALAPKVWGELVRKFDPSASRSLHLKRVDGRIRPMSIVELAGQLSRGASGPDAPPPGEQEIMIALETERRLVVLTVWLVERAD